ncbi:MAG: ComF family protein [Muribaculaceae bacterium]|nr:ComF family protein [Muribaculaceae bacterium]
MLTDLLNILFPRKCHICDSSLAPHERFACSHCLADLPRSGFHRRKLNPMEERFAGIFPFERATGHFLYNRDSPLSTLIQDMKYRHFPSIGNMLGEIAGKELFSTGFFSDADLIIPVPMHRWKQIRRGYNQVHHIADGLSQATGIPVNLTLKAVRSHRTQTALNREQRLANTSGLFKVENPDEVAGRHILLIDDVCTTGSTLISSAETIWQAKPRALSLFTLAVTF